MSSLTNSTTINANYRGLISVPYGDQTVALENLSRIESDYYKLSLPVDAGTTTEKVRECIAKTIGIPEANHITLEITRQYSDSPDGKKWFLDWDPILDEPILKEMEKNKNKANCDPAELHFKIACPQPAEHCPGKVQIRSLQHNLSVLFKKATKVSELKQGIATHLGLKDPNAIILVANTPVASSLDNDRQTLGEVGVADQSTLGMLIR